MLGYMIYFFPMAGFCRELINFCEITLLHRDPRLFPEQTASAQGAMVAYLRRMAETMGGSQNDPHVTMYTKSQSPESSETREIWINRTGERGEARLSSFVA